MTVDGLRERIAFVRALFAKCRVPLKPGEGLATALGQAEALSQWLEVPDDPRWQGVSLAPMIDAGHVLWVLGENLKTVSDAGLDVTAYLKQITTGTTDYGTGAAGTEAKRIYFKDFELELFIAGTLVREGVTVALADPPNSPLGDLVVGRLRVEVKHPNSLNQLGKLAGQFQSKLARASCHGIFVVGLEDASALGDQPPGASHAEYSAWLAQKRVEMDEFGLEFLARVARYDRVVGTVQTSTHIARCDGSSRLVREGNAFLFDDGRSDAGIQAEAEQLARVFNPEPKRLSQLTKRPWKPGEM